MSDEQTIQHLVAYIQQNQAAFPDDVLRAELLRAGHSEANVNAAFARINAQPATPITPITPINPDEPQITPISPQTESDKEQIASMAGYLRQNIGTYNLGVLRQQLIDQGQPIALVDQAVAQVQPQTMPPERIPTPWPLTIGLILLTVFVAPLIGVGLVAATQQPIPVRDFNEFTWAYAGSAFFIVPLVGIAELIATGIVRRRGNPRLSKALMVSGIVGVVMPLVLGCLFFGVCIYLISGV